MSITLNLTGLEQNTNTDTPKDDAAQDATGMPWYLYGAAAGGAVLVASTVSIGVHFIGKRLRANAAEDGADEFNAQKARDELDRLRGTII